ncbi:MAG TPA: molybdopterin-dependent oxidoreductase [Actinomycetes bacterium]|nr:molybdopterin-dependent oxidoreductase [Actinomycetes bacterium]
MSRTRPNPVEPPSVAGPSGTHVGRRLVLGMVGLGAVGVAFGSSLQSGIATLLGPVRSFDPTGLSALVPGEGGWRYYSVTAQQPNISVADYQLTVGGLVDQPMTFSYADLADLPQSYWTRDFQCVTGWRVQDAKWQGVRLRDVFAVVGPQSAASAVAFRSADGSYTESLTLEQATNEEVMVATHLDGVTVPQEHGGPARLVVVPMYGYKSLKWLQDVELVDHVEPGYWEVRGYDVDAYVGQSNGRSDDPI